MRFPATRFALLALFVLASLLIACTSEGAETRTSAPLYVAIAASDGVGTGARNPGSEGWVAQLRGMMPPSTRLANLSIPSLPVHQALDQVLPVAVDLQPSVVTVWLAVNDLATGVPLDAYRADLDTLLGTLARDTHARVYVANLPDLTLLPAFRGFAVEPLRAEIGRWNASIAETAAAHAATLVDLYSGWLELRDRPDYVSRDGLHPTTAGHQRLAELFWQAMERKE